MKRVLFGLLIATATSCGSSSKSSDDTPGPAPSADQSPLSGFLPSDQNLFTAKIVWNNPPVSQSFDNSAEVYLQTKDGQPLTSSRLVRFHLYMVTGRSAASFFPWAAQLAPGWLTSMPRPTARRITSV